MAISGAYSNPAFTNTLDCKTAVVVTRYKAIDVDPTGTAKLPAAAGSIVGIAQDNCTAPHAVPYQHTGITPLVAGTGGLAVGDFFKVDATGGGVRAIAGDAASHGRVLTAAAAGKLATVQLHISNIAPAS